MYKMALVHLHIKPGQTCQHMHTGNHTKPLDSIYFVYPKTLLQSRSILRYDERKIMVLLPSVCVPCFMLHNCSKVRPVYCVACEA